MQREADNVPALEKVVPAHATEMQIPPPRAVGRWTEPRSRRSASATRRDPRPDWNE